MQWLFEITVAGVAIRLIHGIKCFSVFFFQFMGNFVPILLCFSVTSEYFFVVFLLHFEEIDVWGLWVCQ